MIGIEAVYELRIFRQMLQNIIKLLVTAVKQRRCVAIRYRDQREIRVLEPHAIYTHGRGEIVCDAYQTRGYSAAGRPPPFWRPFRIKKITAISLLKETFEPRVEEGFSLNKLKYKKGLVAITSERTRPTFTYSEQALQNMGPFLPNRGPGLN